jgi:hypothetical protein
MRLLASNQKRLTHLFGGFFIGWIYPTCHALTFVEMAKEGGGMNTTKSYSDSHLKRVGINVRQQLLASNAITTKAIQLGIQDAEVIELLDRHIYEWIEQHNKNLIELKGLTGWILFDTVRRQFLD